MRILSKDTERTLIVPLPLPLLAAISSDTNYSTNYPTSMSPDKILIYPKNKIHQSVAEFSAYTGELPPPNRTGSRTNFESKGCTKYTDCRCVVMQPIQHRLELARRDAKRRVARCRNSVRTLPSCRVWLKQVHRRAAIRTHAGIFRNLHRAPPPSTGPTYILKKVEGT